MPIQVAAHGFEMTEALRETCLQETKDKLQQLALHNFSAKWMLSLEKEDHIVHVAWNDGRFHGDCTVRSTDMYNSIHQCAKKAVEQIKKAHDKAYDNKSFDKKSFQTAEETDAEDVDE